MAKRRQISGLTPRSTTRNRTINSGDATPPTTTNPLSTPDTTSVHLPHFATVSNPVGDVFTRRDQLAAFRRERDQLRAAMDADNRTDPDPGTEAGVVVAPVAAAWNEHPCPSAQPVEQAAWAGAFRHHDPARPATWGNRTRGNDGDWETAVNDLIFNRDLYQGGPASRRHEVGTVRGVAVSVQLHDDRSATISINHAYARTGNGNYPCVRITPGQRARINDVANLINAQAATARTTGSPGQRSDIDDQFFF